MSPRDWLKKAQEEGFAIGAFNVGNLETFRAIVAAAAEKRAPVIIESSPGETKWMGARNVAVIARNFAQEYGVDVMVNLDHAERYDECANAMEAGYALIHFDGSKLPYEENVETATRVVETAHAKELLVEGEIDRIAGAGSEVHKEQLTEEEIRAGYTNPERAEAFVRETGVDTFAAFFGNSHGTFPGGQPPLDIELVKKIRAALPHTFLSLHGGSGIEAEQIREAIQAGNIAKVNVNTDMRVAFREALEQTLKDNPDTVALYKILPPVVQAVKEVVARWIDVLGSGGKL